MEWNTCLRNLVLMALTVALVVANGNCYKGGGYGHSGSRFVQRDGNHFTMSGKKIYLNGFNAYWLMYMASDPSTRSKVTATLQQASFHGLNVARTWAFSDAGYKSLQVSPGSYDENVFRGLDFVISEAGKYGVRLILTLVNNWKEYGGKTQYVKWARERGQSVSSDDGFFNHPVVKQYYKNHIKAVLTRRNTITGMAYKDDPAVFAWELMNEPRSEYDRSGKIIQDWVSEMAAYVKSIDRNHLLEIGLEGFYGESMPEKKLFNPGYQLVGTDFISNNQVPHVDFATFHLYPDQWVPGSNESAQTAFVDKWVHAHIEDSNKILRKPILLCEFGKSSKSEGYSVEKRDKYFQKLYDAVYGSASGGGSCAGGLFWQAMGQGMDGFHDGYEVILQDRSSTINIIRQQSQRMSNLK
ncbi:LOW QUALITY PROTEIN: mannan endo-1,4-beta-mannosidase 4-like [Neltuma alba]|uniref:LOW QUALITY PROTEIN: mannan endo-1,4-beta-mannosidase 4-like n=1 Tax=Neltuma alba TaxID=207710 RepID=UPI0010A479D2|nr:LOW QUALITY PROTEIN: mannan endo-1,4-beta-mannosidase 4-like [Prosopis alba]